MFRAVANPLDMFPYEIKIANCNYEIAEWLAENCCGDYMTLTQAVFFEIKEDAALFKLFWG